MSRLNLIVESLLRDIIEAQHAANCHAASLARQYGKHGCARGFQLPSAQIGSLEFKLNYAVTKTTGMEEKLVLDAEQCNLFRQEVVERFPAYVIRSVVMAIAHSDLPDDEARSDFNALLTREEIWKKRFYAFLGQKMNAAMSEREGALLRVDEGLDKGLLTELLAGVSEREFLDNPDVSDLFRGEKGDDLRQECRQKMRESLSSFIDVISEKYAFTRRVANVVVDVEVETDKLKKMPVNAIQTLSLNIAPSAGPAALTDQNDISNLGSKGL